MMNPAQIVTLAELHNANLYRAESVRVVRTTRLREQAPPRERVGWFLVEMGLRLANPS